MSKLRRAVREESEVLYPVRNTVEGGKSMIIAIIVLAVGILLAVISVLLRKKLGHGWMASLLAAGILTAVCGGWFTGNQLAQDRGLQENVFLGLQYLESGQSEPAAFYLKKAQNEDSFTVLAAKYLLELVRGNELNARLRLDSARSTASSAEEQDMVSMLEAVDGQDPRQLSLAVGKLTDLLGISDGRRGQLELFVEAESGETAWDREQLREAGIDENTMDRLRVSRLLSEGSYEQAVSAAVQLADSRPSEENRLLLAEAVGESAYNGVVLTEDAFAVQDAAPAAIEESSSFRERQELEKQRESLEEDLAALELTSAGASKEEQSQMDARKLEITEEIEQLKKREDKLFVYRAFSAIADLHSLKAQIVRARLYFALEDHEKAVEMLLDSANSVQTMLTPDRSLANQLQIVQKAYSSQEELQAGEEFQDSVTQLLSAPFPDLMYLSQSRVTQDFTQKVVSDQRVYGDSLFITRLDTSNFPQIQVTLSGEEEILQQIERQEGCLARDTREDISYTASVEDQSVSNICVVVDRSGSMDGQPMEDLRAALEKFIRDAQEDTLISLVAFDSTSEQLTELTADKSALLTQINGLRSGGGTDITSGINAGITVLNTGGAMLLMTDGQSGIDFSAVDDAAARGITIHTIGFGGVDDALLEQIAQATGGQYIRADSSMELSNIYSSLQQIIGNSLVLEYTAPSPEITEDRYFFFRIGETSVRRDYFLTQEPQNTAELYYASPALVDPEQMARQIEWNGEFSFRFTGDLPQQVTAISIGGQQADIYEQDEWSLQVTLPSALAEGWQTVEITLEDGTVKSYDRLILAGRMESFRNIRLGSLTIPYAQGIVLDGDTLALGGTGIVLTENLSAEASTLSLSVNGTLLLPWTPPPQAGDGITYANTALDLGAQGTITGWGQVLLNREDLAYDDGVPTELAIGELRFECTPDQSRLIQGTGKGVADE